MKKKILYFDCFSGISGDMTVAAMLDLGVDEKYLLQKLNELNIDGYEIIISRGLKKGISGIDFKVIIKNNLHNHSGKHRHSAKEIHTHQSRNITDIFHIIECSKLNDNIKKISKNIFSAIAEAEAKIHAKKIDEIHFHEVGAIDSIIDIVGAAICIDFLKPDMIISSPLNIGGGVVKCEHGILPVPAPATLEILKNVPVYSNGINIELTTPTGAAIIKVLCSEFSGFPVMSIDKTGCGLGKTDLETPNILRIVSGFTEKSCNTLNMLETNIDDMNPEYYSYIMEKLFNAGAKDVFITPIIMKKNRPAQLLSVLCGDEMLIEIENIILIETSTLGIRKYKVERTELKREQIEINSKYGIVKLKKAYLPNGKTKYSPEYEECAKIAKKFCIPIHQAYSEILAHNFTY